MAPPPHSLEMERALLGALLIDPHRIPEAHQTLDPHDLYSPAHQEILGCLYAEHDAGHAIDPTTIAARVTITTPTKVLAELMADCGSTSAAASIAHKLADLAALRRIQALALETVETIAETKIDPATLIDHLTTQIAGIHLAADTRDITGLWTAEAMMDESFPEPPAVVPGFLSQEDRLMLVGPEGKGKSVLARMIAAQVAAGVHPFWSACRIPAHPTLVVDVENPERVIRAGLRMLKAQPAGMHILSRPGGINLRSRRDLSLVHRVCERIQPRLVTIGPLYKMAQAERGENDETAALALQAILDDLRTRFGFALIIEHHAPHGTEMFRNLRPAGSSAWLRWPEFGWKLIPYDPRQGLDSEDGEALRLGTFRGDRVRIDKPHHFYRGTAWPWEPFWSNGAPPSLTGKGRGGEPLPPEPF